MPFTWLKPAIKDLDVNGECTAYAGATRPSPPTAGGIGPGRAAARPGGSSGAPSTPGDAASPASPGSPAS